MHSARHDDLRRFATASQAPRRSRKAWTAFVAALLLGGGAAVATYYFLASGELVLLIAALAPATIAIVDIHIWATQQKPGVSRDLLFLPHRRFRQFLRREVNAIAFTRIAAIELDEPVGPLTIHLLSGQTVTIHSRDLAGSVSELARDLRRSPWRSIATIRDVEDAS